MKKGNVETLQRFRVRIETWVRRTLDKHPRTGIGVTRFVLPLGRRYVVKMPVPFNWLHFLQGLQGNVHEAVFSKHLVDVFPICPVVASIPGGFLNVMPRAEAITEDQLTKEVRQKWGMWKDMAIPIEIKRNNFGVLDGRVVVVDYGG
ncbi:MAG: hypothetical protein DRJ03_02075 [Chloroflexi bacterium]|nr:MAG: hypothetical protein DRJ03_02075 [Chloroflexota bacterium]